MCLGGLARLAFGLGVRLPFACFALEARGLFLGAPLGLLARAALGRRLPFGLLARLPLGLDAPLGQLTRLPLGLFASLALGGGYFARLCRSFLSRAVGGFLGQPLGLLPGSLFGLGPPLGLFLGTLFRHLTGPPLGLGLFPRPRGRFLGATVGFSFGVRGRF